MSAADTRKAAETAELLKAAGGKPESKQRRGLAAGDADRRNCGKTSEKLLNDKGSMPSPPAVPSAPHVVDPAPVQAIANARTARRRTPKPAAPPPARSAAGDGLPPSLVPDPSEGPKFGAKIAPQATPERGDGWPEGTPPSLARGLPAPEQAVIDAALAILTRRVQEPGAVLDCPGRVKELLRLHLAQCERERFGVLFLTSQHAVIAFEVLFEGTLTQTSVYPREVAKRALQLNARAVILAHNHPGGTAEPSQADDWLTRCLSDALRLIDVCVLDHIVIGWPGVVSFAERGMMSEPKPPAWPTPAARPRPVARGRGKAPATALATGGPA
jgi:hypothetical protein